MVHKSIKHKNRKKGNNTLVISFGMKNNIMEGLETGRRKTALTERRCENNESIRAWKGAPICRRNIGNKYPIQKHIIWLK
jgi:hypothetical protein